RITLGRFDCPVEHMRKCLRINVSYFILRLLYDVIEGRGADVRLRLAAASHPGLPPLRGRALVDGRRAPGSAQDRLRAGGPVTGYGSGGLRYGLARLVSVIRCEQVP